MTMAVYLSSEQGACVLAGPCDWWGPGPGQWTSGSFQGSPRLWRLSGSVRVNPGGAVRQRRQKLAHVYRPR